MPNPDLKLVIPVEAGTANLRTGPEGSDLFLDSDDSRRLKFNQSGTVRTLVTTTGGQTQTSPVFDGDVGILDDVSLELGTDDDSVLRHRAGTLAADTALTDVLIGTPVTEALPANSTVLSNITASGDFLLALNRGGNSEAYVWADASAGVLHLTGYAGGVMLGLAADQPAPDLAGEAVHIWDGTAGAVVAETNTRLIVESSDVTANYINLLSPNAAEQAVLFGDVDDANIGGVVYDHATNQIKLRASTTNALVINTNGDLVAAGGLVADTRSSSADTTDGATTYEIAELLTGIVTRSGMTGNVVDLVDTATNIVNGIPGAVAGTSFFFLVNNNDEAQTVTVSGVQTGITYEGTATALAAGETRLFLAVLTNVATPAVTIYQVV